MIARVLQCEAKKGVWSLRDTGRVSNEGREMMKAERDKVPESPHTREVREVESKGFPVLNPESQPNARNLTDRNLVAF